MTSLILLIRAKSNPLVTSPTPLAYWTSKNFLKQNYQKFYGLVVQNSPSCKSTVTSDCSSIHTHSFYSPIFWRLSHSFLPLYHVFDTSPFPLRKAGYNLYLPLFGKAGVISSAREGGGEIIALLNFKCSCSWSFILLHRYDGEHHNRFFCFASCKDNQYCALSGKVY